MPDEPTILVVGSINMDLVVRAPHLPEPGETVLGEHFQHSAGGKGGNQAAAVARLGGRCRMIGRVGRDAFGEQLLEGLKAEGIDCRCVHATEEAPTGVAVILVNARGENSIVVAGGANRRLTPDDVFSCEEAFAGASYVLLQLELPLPTVRAAIDVARRNGCKVILDPAPALRDMPRELYRVDVLSPNAHEAEVLTGAQAIEERIDKQVASELIARGAGAAVLKLGPRGCLAAMADGHFYTVPTYDVPVVDSTGAGDAFTGALALALARGQSMHQAAKFANAAGALACTRIGAQSAMPTAQEVALLMKDQPR
jgi:ribokinase